MSSWYVDKNSWKSVPFSSSICFFAGVFCLFGALFLVVGGADLESQTAGQVFWIVLISGAFATVWA